MVKLTGPAMSLDASGSLGGSLVFSKWKGRNYARTLVKPSNPKSGGQVGVRSMFKFLAQEWASIAAGDQATWEDYADQLVVSPFNAYMSRNQFRFRNFLAPSADDPATETGTAPTAPTLAVTAGERQITCEITDGANAPDFGYVIFRSTSTGFTPAFDNVIAVVPWDSGGVTTYVDTPLDAGTYYYVARGFMDTGLWGGDSAEDSDTVV